MEDKQVKLKNDQICGKLTVDEKCVKKKEHIEKCKTSIGHNIF